MMAISLPAEACLVELLAVEHQDLVLGIAIAVGDRIEERLLAVEDGIGTDICARVGSGEHQTG